MLVNQRYGYGKAESCIAERFVHVACTGPVFPEDFPKLKFKVSLQTLHG